MKNTFCNWYDWNPEFLRNGEEIHDFLTEHGIFGKIIREVAVIGMARNLEPMEAEGAARWSAGFVEKLSDRQIEACTWMDEMLCRCEARCMEPVVFRFEDGTTLEMMPHGGGVQMSCNQLTDPGTDGTNHSNFDSTLYFMPAVGKAITGVQELDRKPFHPTWRKEEQEAPEQVLQFWLGPEWGLYVYEEYDCFVLGLSQLRDPMARRLNTASITYGEVKYCMNPVEQIVLERYGYADVQVRPVNFYGDSIQYGGDMLSIYAGDFLTLLEWYQEVWERPQNSFFYAIDRVPRMTVYTFRSAREMLVQLERCAELLERGKARTSGIRKRRGYTPATVADCYRRIVRRIESMVDRAEDDDYDWLMIENTEAGLDW